MPLYKCMLCYHVIESDAHPFCDWCGGRMRLVDGKQLEKTTKEQMSDILQEMKYVKNKK